MRGHIVGRQGHSLTEAAALLGRFPPPDLASLWICTVT